MKKLIYTSSAAIVYVMYKEKIKLKEVSKILNEPMKIAKNIYKGRRDLTLANYIALTNKFPYLQGSIEYFEWMENEPR